MSYRFLTLIIFFLVMPIVSAQDNTAKIDLIPIRYHMPNIALSHDGKTLVSYEGGFQIIEETIPELLPIQLIDVESRTERASLFEGQDYTQALAISPDNTQLATVEFNGDIFIWDLQTGEHIKTINGLPSQSHMVFIDNTHLATTTSATGISVIAVWDIEAEVITQLFKSDIGTFYGFRERIGPQIQSQAISAMSLNSDGNTVVLSLLNDDIYTLDIPTGERHLVRDSGEDLPYLNIRKLIPADQSNAVYYRIAKDDIVYRLDLDSSVETEVLSIDEGRLVAVGIHEAQDRLMWVVDNANGVSLFMDSLANRDAPRKIGFQEYLPDDLVIRDARILFTPDGNTAIIGGFVNVDSPDNVLLKITLSD